MARHAGISSRVALGILLVEIAIGVLAPLLAGTRPVVCSTGDGLSFPAMGDVIRQWPGGERLLPLTLKEKRRDYRAELTANDEAWALFPLIEYDPRKIPDTALGDRGPSSRHLLGTDRLGRDLLARLIHATGPALCVGFVAIALALSLGILVGAFAGLGGRWSDLLLSRSIEVVTCFPTLFLLLACLTWLPSGRTTIAIVIGLTAWPTFARLVRGEMLSLRERPFVESARAIGVKPTRLFLRHLLPHALSPLLAPALFGVAAAILAESSLAFLGIGVQLEDPSWGGMLRVARRDSSMWMTFLPSACLLVTLLCLGVLGEGRRHRARWKTQRMSSAM